MKGILILTGSRELNLSLLRFLVYVFNIKKDNIYYFTFKDTQLISPDIIQNTDLWIIEGFDPEEPDNPVGWRTAKKCGKKVLVFFLFKPSIYGEARKTESNKLKKYFIIFNLENLKSKIKEVMEKKKPELKDFEEIENMWQKLKYEPSHHHHYTG